MPNNAVMIGRPMARSEPNAINRMTTAARMPMSSLAGIVCSVNMLPASSTRTTSELASFAIERMCVARSTGTSFACTSNRISA